MKSDGYVMALITATLSPSLMHIARNATSASALWKSIDESFFQQVYAKQSWYMTQFHLLKQESKSVVDYLNSAKEIVDVLNAIGNPISDDMFVLQILQGLNPEFESFVTNIENSNDKPNYALLRSKLLTYEARMKQRQSIHTVPLTAMNVSVSGPPHRSESVSSGSGSGSTQTQCQICSKYGHLATNCYFRYSNPSHSRNNSGVRGGFRGRSGGFRGNFRGGFRGGARVGGRFQANLAEYGTGNHVFKLLAC
ncbi:putative transcription factor interactor and regulator CCHC(Zn) family [Helianthus annuus]|uniref:Transcription factor interactor and regulator CCHC(Zn) family n=1 Tax=Helianthus annuus TaxID=4232 RepID=A0A9K3HCX1_HELAN|nr:putative transcription factor interactor and regulator CCHC(Zn) family [Helianthus annuus]